MTSVPGLDRGIAILRLFHRDRPLLGAPQVAVELGIPRSTVHRLLTALVELGLLRRDAGGLFALGAGVLGIGFEYLASLDIVELSNPVLARLRDATDWSTHLTILDGTSVIYLSRHPSRSAVSSNIHVGSSLPAHATIMGRLMLGGLDRDQLRTLYPGRTLPPAGAETPTTLAALEGLIAADRARGYAVSSGFFESGVLAVAAPVYDGQGRIVAAINATALASAADAETLNGTLKDEIVAAAREISALLGAPQPATERERLRARPTVMETNDRKIA
jgi:DNA-binding IclR family transcriptional regulator